MARRKKRTSSKRGGSRRRRVSGIVPDKSTLMLGLGVAGGAYLATLISNKLPASLDSKGKALVTAALGVFVAGQSNPLIKGVGLGVFGAGALQGAKELGVLGNVPMVRISGLQKFPNNPQVQTVGSFQRFPNNPQRSTVGNVVRHGMVSGLY